MLADGFLFPKRPPMLSAGYTATLVGGGASHGIWAPGMATISGPANAENDIGVRFDGIFDGGDLNNDWNEKVEDASTVART